MKFCDAPEPKNGGRLCSCNQSDDTEVQCNGKEATMVIPCNIICNETVKTTSKMIVYRLLSFYLYFAKILLRIQF